MPVPGHPVPGHYDASPKLPAGFNRLAWSNLAAQSADQIALAAAPILAVLLLGTTVGETGLLQAILTLPFVLLALPAGLMADRMMRKHLMAAAEVVRALSLAGIIALLAAGLLTWPLLAGLGFVAVSGTVVFSVAAPALVPVLVPAKVLPAANARVELGRTTAFTAGPALGGILVGWIGAASAFAVAALLSAVAALLLSGLREPVRAVKTYSKPLRDIREGAAFVFGHPLLAPIFATQFVFNSAYFLLLAVFVPHAVQNLGQSATTLGATLAMYGVGMMIGVLIAPRVMAALPFGTVIAIGPFTGVAAALLMALTIWIPTPVLAGASFFLFGAGPMLWVISTTTLRQTITPPALLGRVTAINNMAYGARPLGSGLGALIGAFAGTDLCRIAAAAGFVLQAAIIARSPAVCIVSPQSA